MERARTTPRPTHHFIILAALVGPAAHAGENHVHGQAALEIAADGSRLQLSFRSPLDNLVGFEHAPRTDQQKDAVRRMAAALSNPARQFVPTPDARCTPESARLASDVIDRTLLGGEAPRTDPAKTPRDQREPKGHKGEPGHAELHAEFVFRCDQPEKLSSLEVKLFDAFRALKRIDVQVAGARKQAASRLTHEKRRVSW